MEGSGTTPHTATQNTHTKGKKLVKKEKKTAKEN